MTGSHWEETQAAGLAQEGRTCWPLCAQERPALLVERREAMGVCRCWQRSNIKTPQLLPSI